MISKFFTKIKRLVLRSFMRSRGFTLVETLGAVLLLSIALVGPMVIAEKGLQTSLISKDQNSAFNLAQDAVEYVRFARDTNCLTINAGTGCTGGLITASPMWLHGAIDLSPCVSTDGSNVCYFDSLNNTPAAPTQCNNGTLNVCNVIDYDPTNNYFTYSTANTLATIFTRSVSIKYNPACTGTCNPAEADVVVTVSWSDPVAHSIQVNESIYDWQ